MEIDFSKVVGTVSLVPVDQLVMSYTELLLLLMVLLCLGVISGDLQLSDETVLGEWKIDVKAGVSCALLAISRVPCVCGCTASLLSLSFKSFNRDMLLISSDVW